MHLRRLMDLSAQAFSPLPSIAKGGVRSVQEVRMDGELYVRVYNQVSETVGDVESTRYPHRHANGLHDTRGRSAEHRSIR